MRVMRGRLAILAVGLAMCLPVTAGHAESDRATRVAFLKPYFSPHVTTELDWALLWTNLQWIEAFKNQGNYLRSNIVFYRQDLGRVWTSLIVFEKRSFDDLEPFSSLKGYQKKALMQEAIDHLAAILSTRIPEMKVHPELLEVEFWVAGGTTVLARYRAGELVLSP